MESHVQISVIVPVYNADKYLVRCVESILHQSFADFELLLIDDGSSDGSSSICDDYAARDSRIRIFHQANAGVSAARNLGLEKMRGRYLAFVDADDYVSPHYLQDLYGSLCPDKGSGLVVQGIVQISPTGEMLSIKETGDAFMEFHDFGWAICHYRLYAQGYIASKLYDAELIRKHHLCFDTGIRVLEDLFFMYRYLLCCDYVLLSKKSNYIYVKYPDSGCRTMHPFHSVYAGFRLYQDLLSKMMEQWVFPPDKERDGLYTSLMTGFDWALKTDYRQKGVVSRKIRIAHLRLLIGDNYHLMRHYYHPVYKLDKVGKLILGARLYGLYDWYITSLIKMCVTSFLHAPCTNKKDRWKRK